MEEKKLNWERGVGWGGVYVTAVDTKKTPCVVNIQPVTLAFSLGEGVACNTILSCPFL